MKKFFLSLALALAVGLPATAGRLIIVENATWDYATPGAPLVQIDCSNAATLTQSGDNTEITAATDATGSGQTWARQGGVGPKYQTNEQNGKSVCETNGNGGLTTTLSGGDQTVWTIGCVAKPTTLTQYNVLWTSYQIANFPTHQMNLEISGGSFGGNAGAFDDYESGVGVAMKNSTSSITTNTWYAIMETYSTTTNSGALYLNNVQNGTTAITDGIRNSHIGFMYDGAAGFFRWQGQVGECTMWNVVLGSTDRAAWYSKMQAKWGL